MSEDWPGGWYQDEKPTGSTPAADATRDMTFAAPPSGSTGAPRAPGWGGGAGSNWPEQPPQRSEDGNGADWGRRASGLRRDGDYGPPGRFRRAFLRMYPPGKRGRRIALTAGLLVVVLIIALVGSYFWIDGKLNRSVTLPAFSGQSAGQNWLIVGSDSRQGLSRAEVDQLHVGTVGADASDSLMLLHMGTGRPVLISIPRDSYVPIPGYGDNKINAALAFGGPTLLVKTVENVTGLRINHYMGIGFGGLVSVVNTVGGVRICLPSAINDSYSGVNLSAGCHNLNGDQSLAFVRDRHSFADLGPAADPRPAGVPQGAARQGDQPGRIPQPVRRAAVRLDRGEFDLGRQGHEPLRPDGGGARLARPADRHGADLQCELRHVERRRCRAVESVRGPGVVQRLARRQGRAIWAAERHNARVSGPVGRGLRSADLVYLYL